jgi:MFS family permease
VLAICCLSLFVVGMDATIINVALPAIGRGFRAPVSGLQWAVDAYLLVMGVHLVCTWLGPHVTRRGKHDQSKSGCSHMWRAVEVA